MIRVYKGEQLNKIRAVCAIVRDSLILAEQEIRAGMTTSELDSIVERFIIKSGANPSCKGYHGYPAATCISVNDTVVHGIPSLAVIKEGDIVSLDITAEKDGFYGDACRTFIIGNATPERIRLVETAKDAFNNALKFAKEGCRLGDIGFAVSGLAETRGYGVVRDYTGHGIGAHMHEDPEVLNFGMPNSGAVLKAGYVLAIEPMITAGNWRVKIEPDGWTAKTLDGSDAAHYENTVLITNGEPEVLTL